MHIDLPHHRTPSFQTVHLSWVEKVLELSKNSGKNKEIRPPTRRKQCAKYNTQILRKLKMYKKICSEGFNIQLFGYCFGTSNAISHIKRSLAPNDLHYVFL